MTRGGRGRGGKDGGGDGNVGSNWCLIAAWDTVWGNLRVNKGPAKEDLFAFPAT